MSISNNSQDSRKKISYGLWLTLLIFCIVGLGDMRHPDGVSGASRSYGGSSGSWPVIKPQPYPGQEPEQPKPKPKKKPKAVKQDAPTNILVSQPAATPPTAEALPITASSLTPDSKGEPHQNFNKVESKSQKFAGVVGFVTDQNLNPGVLQKASVLGGEELLNLIILAGTKFFANDGTPAQKKSLAVGDRVLVIYEIYDTGRGDSENVAVAIMVK